LYKKTSSKSIPFLKLGSRVLFDEDALVRWVRSHTVQPIGYGADFSAEEQDNNSGVLDCSGPAEKRVHGDPGIRGSSGDCSVHASAK
jgi:hypothetical protein